MDNSRSTIERFLYFSRAEGKKTNEREKDYIKSLVRDGLGAFEVNCNSGMVLEVYSNSNGGMKHLFEKAGISEFPVPFSDFIEKSLPYIIDDEHKERLAAFDVRSLSDRYETGERSATLEVWVSPENERTICLNSKALFRKDEKSGEVFALVVCHDVTENRYNETILKDEHSDSRASVRDSQYYRAIVSEASSGFEVNLSKDVITGGILENSDGFLTLTFERLKLTPPCSFYEFKKRIGPFLEDHIAERILEFFSASGLIEKYNNGINYDEISFWCNLADIQKLYLRTTVFMSQDEETKDIIALVLIRNKTEEMLKDENQRLVMKNALVSANKSERMRNEFVNRISSSIKGPVSAIARLTEAIKNCNISSEVSGYVEKLSQSTERINQLISEMVDYAHLTSGDIDIADEEFDFNEIINNCTAIVRGAVINRNVSFIVERSPLENHIFRGDGARIQQVLMNILETSVHMTDSGGRITLKTEKMDDVSGGVRIIISDTGIGFAEDFLTDIFEPFSQNSYSERSMFHGSGLTLTVAKSLVEYMGGKITVRNSEGEGTVYTVELPLKAADEPESTNDGTSLNEKRKTGKVLVVDDSDINLEISKRLLLNEGVEVITATNGKDAIREFMASEEGSVDAIIMDIVMPVMNGYEAAKAIRALNRKDAAMVTIIAASANPEDNDIDRLTEAGMDSYMVKPLDVSLFFKILAVTYNDHVKKGLKREDRLRIEADMDSLSEIYNRRAFIKIVKNKIASGTRGAFAILDIDMFKEINDRNGHSVGDEMIKKVGALLQKGFRGDDIVARIGGDEFAVWLSDIDESKSEYVKRRFDSINEEAAEFDGKLPPATLSVGVAFLSEGEDYESVYRKADIALYDVKNHGRNGCRVYGQ